jgi:putative oxidoreductase
MRKILPWAPPLLARLVTGLLFFGSGWGKIHNLGKFITDFAGWGIPAPQVMAPFVGWSEFILGALLIVGLLSRLASFAMLINMGVAICAVKLQNVHTLGDFLYLPEVLLVALLFWLTVEGAGRASVDFYLRWDLLFNNHFFRRPAAVGRQPPALPMEERKAG